LYFLLGYSLELNPDECVNNDTKLSMRKHRPRDAVQMMNKVRQYMSRRQKQPEIVKRFFNEAHVQHAA
jgi:hypothetical protein